MIFQTPEQQNSGFHGVVRSLTGKNANNSSLNSRNYKSPLGVHPPPRPRTSRLPCRRHLPTFPGRHPLPPPSADSSRRRRPAPRTPPCRLSSARAASRPPPGGASPPSSPRGGASTADAQARYLPSSATPRQASCYSFTCWNQNCLSLKTLETICQA